MIISRKGVGQNYLVFAADGNIRLDKKHIGAWQMLRNPRLFTALLNIGGTSRRLTDSTKYGIMQQVANVIPDAMLIEN